MVKPVNLNRFRKEKARAAKKARADENAVKFGRTKAQKDAEAKLTEYSIKPSSNCQVSVSPLSWFSRMTFRPGHNTALARSRCLSRETEIFGESKYDGSGQKRRMVPVLRLPTVSTTSRSAVFSPPANSIRCTSPSRLTNTSSFFDRALTTDTPTPCRPPENW